MQPVSGKEGRGRALQILGVDAYCTLPDGTRFSVQEKVRTEDYGDVLLEYVSNSVENKPGWAMESHHVALLLYAIEPTGRGVLMPFAGVYPQVTLKNLDRWKADGVKVAENPSYRSYNVAVKDADLAAEVDLALGLRPCPSCGLPRLWSEVRGGAFPLGCARCRPWGVSPWKLKVA